MWLDRLIRLFGFLLAFAGMCVFLCGLLLGLIFLDGMGPDSDSSSGWLALWGSMKEFWVILCISLPLCAVGGYLWRRPSKDDSLSIFRGV